MQLNRHDRDGFASVAPTYPPTLTRHFHLYLQSWQATAHAVMDHVSRAIAGNGVFLPACHCVQLPTAPAYEVWPIRSFAE
jgi:hypothetical protein